MNEHLDLVTVGDASLDAFIFPSETETVCTIDKKECLVCFNYGDKIPVTSLAFSIGGNAANNAVGAKRLGLSVALVTTLGDDITGKQIHEVLQNEGINLNYTNVTQGGASNYSSILNYAGERTIFSYHSPKNYHFPENLPVSKWVYLTSVGDGYETFYADALGWLSQHSDTKLAFNPGSKQLRGDMNILKGVLKKTHLLYVNREEAQKIAEFGDSAGKEKELLHAVSLLGPQIVVITDGPNGAFVFNGQSYFYAPVYPQEAISRTGAGDAFGSGCLSGLIKGKTLEEALLWGAINSASVISKVGAQTGLLHAEEMQQWLDRAHSQGIMVVALNNQ